jgi:uncharacterized NAD(P)/FAD-binding protein YdhS
VIVGGGASGTLVAARLLAAPRPPSEVVLIEKSAAVGRGVAYSTPHREHVLNVPAGRMSALAEDPEHFMRWLGAAPNSYPPRAIYGDYLNALLDEAGTVRRIKSDVQRITIEGDRAIVDDIDADLVVLAMGHLATRFPIDAENVVVDPWAEGALDSLPLDGELFIAGTGLTMVDIVLNLRRRGHQGTIHALSRHGLVARPHPRQRATFPVDTGVSETAGIRELVRRVRIAVDKAHDEGKGWEDVMDTLRPIGGQIWQRLSVDDRKRFLRHVRPFWEVHRHRMAPEVANEFERLRDEGYVRIYAGRLLRAKHGVIEFTSRHDGSMQTLRVAGAINATGPSSDWRNHAPPLVRSLIADRHARIDSLGLGLDATADGHLLDANGNRQERLVAIGPLLRGVLWETTAIPEIREQARRIAENYAGGS